MITNDKTNTTQSVPLHCAPAEFAKSCVFISATGDGRWWVLANLPGRSSITIYYGSDEKLAKSIHEQLSRIIGDAIAHERQRCAKVAIEAGEAKAERYGILRLFMQSAARATGEDIADLILLGHTQRPTPVVATPQNVLPADAPDATICPRPVHLPQGVCMGNCGREPGAHGTSTCAQPTVPNVGPVAELAPEVL